MHDDYELVAVLNAKGSRFIGDNVSEFNGAEVVLVALGLPHCWHVTDTVDGKSPIALVIHFSRQCMGGGFFETPELSCFYSVLKQATRGVLIQEKSITKVLSSVGAIDQPIIPRENKSNTTAR